MLSIDFVAGPLVAGANRPDVATGLTSRVPEPFLSINPADPGNLAISNQASLLVTTNAGGTLSAATGFNAIAGVTASNGDTGTAFDSQNQLFWTNLDDPGPGRNVAVARMNPTTAAAAGGITNPPNPGAQIDDKQFLAADSDPFGISPFADNLYVSFQRIGGALAEWEVFSSVSTNGAGAWSAPLQVSNSAVEGFTWPSTVNVAPGGDVYLAYHSQPDITDAELEGAAAGAANPNGTSGQVFVLRSTDGGVTFPQKTLAMTPGQADVSYNRQDVPGGVGLIPGARYWMVGSVQPWVMADPVRPGSVYVVSNDDPDNVHGVGDEGDVVFAFSNDYGLTWQQTTIPDGATGAYQFFPNAAIDRFGNIVVSWYDNRRGLTNANGNFLLDSFATYSVDGGQNWAPAFMVSDPGNPLDPDVGVNQRFPNNGNAFNPAVANQTSRIGEYQGIDVFGGTGYVLFSSNNSTTVGGAPEAYLGAFAIQGALVVGGDESGAAANDQILIRAVAGNPDFVEVLVNGARQYVGLQEALTGGITVRGYDGNDTLTVDYSNGFVNIDIAYDGGTQTSSPGDRLVVAGNGANHGVYTPDSLLNGNGVVQVDGSTITFSGLEPVTVSGFAEFTFVTPNSNDSLSIDSPAAGQNRISGTSGGVGFEALTFSNVGHFLVDTATNDGPVANSNDVVAFAADLVATGLQSFTVKTGDGDDTVNAANVLTQGITILAGGGDDLLIGGGGADYMDGGAGSDSIRGAGGADSLFGGDGPDGFPHFAGDGSDVVLDGGGGDDNLAINGGPGVDTTTLLANGALGFIAGFDGAAFSVNFGAIESVSVSPGGGADAVAVGDLSGTDIQAVWIDYTFANDAVADQVTIDGRSVADQIGVTLVNPGANSIITVSGLAAVVRIVGAVAANDTLRINALGGDDRVEADAGIASQIQLTLDGGAGNDDLSADATLIGGAGNDFLQGGLGANSIAGNDGEDVMIGGAGNDTFDGGAGFDTILVRGASGNDTIQVNQSAAATLVETVNGDAQTDTLVLADGVRTVEAVRVEAGAGDDVISAAWADSLGVDAQVNSLRIDVFGGAAATRDRLGVVDSGIGDLVLYRKGATDDAGSITIGPSNAEPLELTFDGVEFVQPQLAAGGDLVVFKHDPFESNDALGNATHLGANGSINVDPTIDPGAFAAFNLPADADWYRLEAEYTGMLDVQVLFRQISTVASGRPGLPGNGNLDIRVLDSNGDEIASSASVNDDEQVRIPVIKGQIYYLEVFGAFGSAVNNYAITTINTAAPVPVDVVLDPTNDTGWSAEDQITFQQNGEHYYVHVDLKEFADAGIAVLTPAQATAGNVPGVAVQVFDNGVAVGYAAAVAGTDNSIFEIAFNGSTAKFPVLGPNAAGVLGYAGWLNFVTAAVKVYDGQNNGDGGVTPATGRTELSPPLKVTLDTTVPLAPINVDLLASSDSGVSNSDNITNVNPPAFSGLAEANTRVRVLANGVVVGEGLVGTDGTDGVLGNGLGAWEVTVEPLADGTYLITALVEDIAGNISPPSSPPLEITIDTLEPQRPTLDLLAAWDTGSSDLDDVTRLTSIDVRVSAEPGATVVIKNGETVVDTFTMVGQFMTRTLVVGVAIPASDLLEGPNPLSAEAFDTAGNRSHQSEELLVQIDTIAPAAPSTPDLLASSDTGSFSNDNVTNINAPAFQGAAEANSLVRIFANGVVVGQARVGSDTSDGVLGNGLGAWEVTVEPLSDGAYAITAQAEDLAGNIGLQSNVLNIVVDTLSPDTPYLDLVAASDSGRSNVDNITNDNTPTVTTTADDVQAAGLNVFPHEIRYRIFDRFGAGPDVLLVNSFATIPGLTTANFFTDTLPLLADGVHNLKVEVEDRAGNISHAFLLSITVDTAAPAAPSIQIDPASTDTGVDGYPATIADRVTSDTASSFVGTAEADAIVRLFADANPLSLGAIDGSDVAEGLTVAVPTDGNAAFPGGQWRQAVIRDLNDPGFFPQDGTRQMGATAEDVAGNVSAPGFLDIFIDTQGPQITNVGITGSPGYNLFGTKPGNAAQGPTPLVNSITINVRDLPNRDTALFPGHTALWAPVAATPGNYILKGDAVGYIPVQSVSVVNNPLVNGSPATATVELVFANPLPDDRYTLIVLDALVDPAGNKLDGESNAAEPNGLPSFPTGDGQTGGGFIGRFTVDSRPEVGVWAAGSVWVDTNGNAQFDPTNPDFTNRDIVYTLGYTTDFVFAGNFARLPGDAADGFDKLAAYGRVNNQARWLIDINHDGVPDVVQTEPSNIIGMPAAGDFDGNAVNGDEVALKSGNTWWLDTNHDFQVDTALPGTNMAGFPIVGDFDGDGIDDLGAWADDRFSLNLSTLGPIDGSSDVSFGFGFIGVRERPVAADVDGDGIDDLGLWAPDRSGAVPTEQSEWYLLVSAGRTITARLAAGAGAIHFTPVPFGSDVYVRFGDDFALPVLGNFDPPIGGGEPALVDPPIVPTINGTSGNDTFEFTAGADPAHWVVKLNGVVQSIDPSAVKLHFAGGGGTDTVKFLGASGADQVELWPDNGVFTGAGYLLTVSQVESILANGAGGNDQVVLHDSAFADTLTASAAGGQFVGKNGTALIFSHSVSGFESITASAEAGGPDAANFVGATKTDKFTASPTKAEMAIAAGLYSALGFESVVANAGSAGTGAAWLYDSAGNDTFTGKPGLATLVGSGFSLTAKGFGQVTATASGGYDVAQLVGSTGNDTLASDRASSRLYGKGFSNLAKSFDEVHANGLGGTDTAQIVGGKVATGKLARGSAALPTNLNQLAWLVAFEQVQQKNSTGATTRTLRAARNQVFTAYWS